MTTPFKVLPIAAKHPGQLYVSGSLTVLALEALAVSYGAIAALARNRGSAVATAAALIGGLGAFCGAALNVADHRSGHRREDSSGEDDEPNRPRAAYSQRQPRDDDKRHFDSSHVIGQAPFMESNEPFRARWRSP
jgi:hypothetical protein